MGGDVFGSDVAGGSVVGDIVVGGFVIEGTDAVWGGREGVSVSEGLGL